MHWSKVKKITIKRRDWIEITGVYKLFKWWCVSCHCKNSTNWIRRRESERMWAFFLDLVSRIWSNWKSQGKFKSSILNYFFFNVFDCMPFLQAQIYLYLYFFSIILYSLPPPPFFFSAVDQIAIILVRSI